MVLQRYQDHKHTAGHPNCKYEPDRRSFEVLNSIADTVDRNLRFTSDFPSNNADGKLPILDLTVGMEGLYILAWILQKAMCTSKDHNGQVGSGGEHKESNSVL